MKLRALAWLLVTSTCACSGSSGVHIYPSDASTADVKADATTDAAVPPSTSVSGGFVARSAAFRTSVSADGNPIVDVVLSDSEDACKSERKKGAKVLQLTLRASAEGELAPGTFNIVDTELGGAGSPSEGTAYVLGITDVGTSSCVVSNLDHAVLGTVTLTAVTDGVIEGTLDIVSNAPGAKAVQGQFAAKSCRTPSAKSMACTLRR